MNCEVRQPTYSSSIRRWPRDDILRPLLDALGPCPWAQLEAEDPGVHPRRQILHPNAIRKPNQLFSYNFVLWPAFCELHLTFFVTGVVR